MQVSPGTSEVAGRRLLGALLVAALVAALDQATKIWAVAADLDRDPVELIGSTVRLHLTRNRGSAFSLFTGHTAVLAVLAVALVGVLVWMLRRETDRGVILGLALVLGGALGNLADRLFRAPGPFEGSVVDFIDVGAWPTFNVADVAITLGALWLILRGWRHDSPERDSRQEGDRAG